MVLLKLLVNTLDFERMTFTRSDPLFDLGKLDLSRCRFLGLIVMCYVYSPFHENVTFQWTVKLLLFPVITLTGVWIWKFKAINNFLKIP